MERKPRLKVDSREQKPLSFNKEVFESIVTEGLPFGDYWAEVQREDGAWCEIPICFERKGLGDLFGTMGQGYDRFKREMERAKDVNVHLILAVEGTLGEVHNGYEHSTISGDTMLKKLSTLRVKYDLEVMFFSSRREMARWIEELFSAVARNYSKEGEVK